tara:strand:+ start:814 stop:1014 length:201 start_codon:yes stop_codon:yes gene_type:complete
LKIKEYTLVIIINDETGEILHLSEKYDCPDSNDYTYKLEIMGVKIDVPKSLVKYLDELENEEIGLA